ncbi:MAG: TfoX/Sxy family protein [Pigmentiphaga sp.]|nr:TfoX/Sxy family protein [Pigmentiphaga sp.]
MAAPSEFVRYQCDRLQFLGAVEPRRMFSGHGLFLDGRMFALVIDDELYLKADAGNRPVFETRGMRVFSYSRRGKIVELGYYALDAEAQEDEGLLLDLARLALEAAWRAPRPPARRRRSSETPLQGAARNRSAR